MHRQTHRQLRTSAQTLTQTPMFANRIAKHRANLPTLVGDAPAKTFHRRPAPAVTSLVSQDFHPSDWSGLTQIEPFQEDNTIQDGVQLGGTAMGTSIVTAKGKVPIETLRAGDKVFTLDHGLQPVRHVLVTTVLAPKERAPIRFGKGTIGNSADVWACPDQQVLVRDWKAELLFGDNEVLVAAHHLIDGNRVTRDSNASKITYFHLLFETHQIVMAEGGAIESLNPYALNATNNGSARKDLMEKMPELKFRESRFGAPIRKSLKAHEAQVLIAQIKRKPAI